MVNLRRPAALVKRPASAAIAKRPASVLKRPASALKRPASALKRPAAPPSPPPFLVESPVLRALLTEHLLESVWKQAHLEDVVGGKPYSLNLEGGTPKYGKLCFGDDLEFHCCVLGSESYESDTWRWAWANESVPEDLSRQSKLLCQEGPLAEHFSEANMPLENGTGYQLATVACGILGCPAYYSFPTGPFGRAFVLIQDPTFPVWESQGAAADTARYTRVIGQALELGWLDDTVKAVDIFLKKMGATCTVDGSGKPTYELPGGEAYLKLKVSRDGQLAGITATFKK